MKIKQNEQTLILTAFIAVVLFFAYHFIFGPMFTNYKKLYEKEDLYKSKIESNINIIKNRDVITENYNLLFEKYMLTGDDEDELLKTEQEIDQISRARKLQITKIQSAPVKELPEYKQFHFQIECYGSLSQIGSFIFYLSKSPMLFNVHRIKIQPAGTQTDSLRASIMISRIGFPSLESGREDTTDDS